MNITDLQPIYCEDGPSNQTIADILHGQWYSQFPEQYHVQAGQVRHFDFEVDPRVKWVNSILPGGIRGMSILELGPFEAYNTWQFEQLGAQRVVSIEANNINYLKCLLVKEITGLKAKFLHGDFTKYLQSSDERFDIVWASGVLYHQTEPFEFLRLLGAFASKLYIMTHYYDAAIIEASEHLSGFMEPRNDKRFTYDGFTAPLHFRSYRHVKGAVFAGGISDYSYWIEKQDLMNYLARAGFDQIRVHLDHPQNPNGPAISLFAEKQGQ